MIEETGLKKALLTYYNQFITEERQRKFDQIIRNRTRYMTVVLEDIYQPHNASAVLRSCECFGVQDIHIIENKNEYQVNPDVALGSNKWLSIYKYNQSTFNTPSCFDFLRSKGYRILATTPHYQGVELSEVVLAKGKFALVFGTEYEGLTDEAIRLADEFVKIPMVGFTESLNISVTAALFLHDLTRRLRGSDLNWQLPIEESLDVRLQWARNSVKKWEVLEREFLRNYSSED